MANLIRVNFVLPLMAVLLVPTPAWAQPPGAGGEGMSWQVAVLFTVNWVLAAVAVAMMSRPSKRADKPKKRVEDEA